MRRRRFIALAGMLAASPFSALAQESRKFRIGVLIHVGAESWRLVRSSLQDLGYVEGRNVSYEVRDSGARQPALAAMAADLVRLKVDLIITFQTPAAQAASEATTVIPIVMASVGDPVATGLVKSLAQPGGNITGFSGLTDLLGAKILDLVREIRPGAARVAVLANSADSFTPGFVRQIRDATGRVGMQAQVALVRGETEYDALFSEWSRAGVAAVILQPSLPRARAIDLAIRHRLPVAGPSVPIAEAGALFAYGANVRDQMTRTAVYVDRILKGEKPSNLPVQQPVVFELVINLRTARAIGLAVPNAVLARADRVIE